MDGIQLRDPIDWAFTLAQWKPGKVIEIEIRREKETIKSELVLAERKRQNAVAVTNSKPGLLCYHTAYDPNIPNPLEVTTKPSESALTIATVTAKPDGVKPDDHYVLFAEGFLKVEKAGLYRLGLNSDDGSLLYLHNKLLIDNNGNHAPILRTKLVDLEAGLHPIKIEFYEDQGNQVLELLMAKDGDELSPVPAKSLIHSAPEKEPVPEAKNGDSK